MKTNALYACRRLGRGIVRIMDWTERQSWYPLFNLFAMLSQLLITILGLWKWLEILVWLNS